MQSKCNTNRAQGLSICKIAKLLGRNKSTISRKLARNPGEYLPSKAQARYKRRRKKSRPHKLLENTDLFALVKKLFLDRHWSPEQIANRLKLEGYSIRISYKTIYRAIYMGLFDTPEQKRSTGNRGKIPISNELSARPVEVNERSRFGDFEVDTIVGKNRKSGLLTLVDRKKSISAVLQVEQNRQQGSSSGNDRGITRSTASIDNT